MVRILILTFFFPLFLIIYTSIGFVFFLFVCFTFFFFLLTLVNIL